MIHINCKKKIVFLRFDEKNYKLRKMSFFQQKIKIEQIFKFLFIVISKIKKFSWQHGSCGTTLVQFSSVQFIIGASLKIKNEIQINLYE